MNTTINQQKKLSSRRAKDTIALVRVGLISFACLAGAPTASSAAPTRSSENVTKSLSSGFILPFTNGRITSRFHQGRWHPGIDLAAPIGTAIVATTSGQKVSFAGRRGGYGNVVITLDSRGRTHLYAHLQTIAVRGGQVLKQGQKLGTVGSTGYSTGPHLHYEVRNVAGKHVDPAPLLFSRSADRSRPRG